MDYLLMEDHWAWICSWDHKIDHEYLHKQWISFPVKLKKIKRVLLAVAQTRSLHIVHEAYPCKLCWTLWTHFGQLIKIWSDQKKEKQNQNQQKKIELPKKEPCQHLISSKLISSTESIYACANMAVLYIIMVFIHKKICIFVFSLLMSKVMFSHLEKRGIQVRWSYVIRKRHVTGKLSWAWIMSNCQHSEILC